MMSTTNKHSSRKTHITNIKQKCELYFDKKKTTESQDSVSANRVRSVKTNGEVNISHENTTMVV